MIKTELHSLYSCRSRRCTRMSVLCSYHVPVFSMHIIDAAAVVVVMKFISYAAALMHGYVCSLCLLLVVFRGSLYHLPSPSSCMP